MPYKDIHNSTGLWCNITMSNLALIKHIIPFTPIPMATRSMAQVCGRLLAGTAVSDLPEGMNFRLLCLLCVV
jgi:hypothetical protein